MAEPPPAPEDLSPAEQRAWRRGGAAMLHLVAGHAATLAGALDGSGETSLDDAGEDDGQVCPDCGGEVVDAFGGAVCPACGYEEDSDDEP